MSSKIEEVTQLLESYYMLPRDIIPEASRKICDLFKPEPQDTDLKCPKVEWPLVAVATENSTQQDLDYAAGCFDQRQADIKRCLAQQEGKP